jgi:hypothetical protein
MRDFEQRRSERHAINAVNVDEAGIWSAYRQWFAADKQVVMRQASSQVIGNVITIILLTLLYSFYSLFQEYFAVIVWALVLSVPFHAAKQQVISYFVSLNRRRLQQKTRMSVVICQDLARATMHREFVSNNVLYLLMGFGLVIICIQLLPVFLNGIDPGTILVLCAVPVSILGFLALIEPLALMLFDRGIHQNISATRLHDTAHSVVAFCIITSVWVIVGGIFFVFAFQFVTDCVYGARETQLWLVNNQELWYYSDDRFIFKDEMHSAMGVLQDLGIRVESYANSTEWFPIAQRLYFTIVSNANATTAANAVNGTNFTTVTTSIIPPVPTMHEAAVATSSSLAHTLRELYDYLQRNEVDLVDVGQQLHQYISGATRTSVVAIFDIVMFVLWGTVSVFDYMFQAGLFFSILMYFTSRDSNDFSIPYLTSSQQQHISNQIRKSIHSVVMIPIQLGLSHALFTFMILLCLSFFFDITLISFATLMALVLGAVPVVPPIIGGVLYCALLIMQGNWLAGSLFVVTQYAAFSFVDGGILQRVQSGLPVSIIALSYAMGWYWIGIQGVLLGPLVLCGLDLLGTFMTLTSSIQNT